MKKKIGIITLNGYNNYGNRLQNFATQEVLKSLGFNVETIINDTDSKINHGHSKITSIIKKIQKAKSNPSVKIHNRINKMLYKNIIDDRIKLFKEFTSSHIIETDFRISENDIPNNLSMQYDYFVTGSDQVWNPFSKHGSSIDFLTFAPREKRISFSPSFGVSEIPGQYIKNYRVWLSEMGHLSVREKAGAKIIKELTGREATVLVDPTLMLQKEKWLSVSEVPSNKPIKKYLLTYFLGGKSKEKNNIISTIAKKNDLEIINLAQIKDKAAYLAGPGQFIDYINSAKVLLTDSFHGAVFAILLNTPFIVFNRNGSLPSMNSRIDTLLSTFKLESRLAKNIKTNKQIFEADYFHTVPILEAERKKALDYLKETLDVSND